VDRVEDDIATRWAGTMIKVPVSDALFARRFDAVRVFARHQHAIDPATQVPALQARPRRYRAQPPNVFSDRQVEALLAATDTLTPPFTAPTWRTLIGLLATTGMRPGEACHLGVDDVNLGNGAVQVLQAKFGKSRLVFIHPSTATILGVTQAEVLLNPAVAQAFGSQALPPLRETLAASKQVHPASPRLKQLDSHAVSALQEDIRAFEVLVIAYRNQDHQRLAAGRALRDSSPQHRAAWIREALTMGQDSGIDSASGEPR
jgi:integrase